MGLGVLGVVEVDGRGGWWGLKLDLWGENGFGSKVIMDWEEKGGNRNGVGMMRGVWIGIRVIRIDGIMVKSGEKLWIGW